MEGTSKAPMTNLGIEIVRRPFAGAAVLLLLCGSSLSAADKPETFSVEISQMRYGTVPDHLTVGDKIVWVNKDSVTHTVTAKDHAFDMRIPPGKRVSQTLSKAGTFRIYCIYHPAMRGMVKVAPGG